MICSFHWLRNCSALLVLFQRTNCTGTSFSCWLLSGVSFDHLKVQPDVKGFRENSPNFWLTFSDSNTRLKKSLSNLAIHQSLCKRVSILKIFFDNNSADGVATMGLMLGVGALRRRRHMHHNTIAWKCSSFDILRPDCQKRAVAVDVQSRRPGKGV